MWWPWFTKIRQDEGIVKNTLLPYYTDYIMKSSILEGDFRVEPWFPSHDVPYQKEDCSRIRTPSGMNFPFPVTRYV